jgi:hypothetical protein
MNEGMTNLYTIHICILHFLFSFFASKIQNNGYGSGIGPRKKKRAKGGGGVGMAG